jgi:hypothetical protein
LLKDPDAGVRQLAALILDHLDPDLEHVNPKERARASRALQEELSITLEAELNAKLQEEYHRRSQQSADREAKDALYRRQRAEIAALQKCLSALEKRKTAREADS